MIALAIYRVALGLFFPLVILRLLWRALRDRRYLEKMPQRFGVYARGESQNYPVWIHAVSVGEVNAAAPLARHLLARHAHLKILITTMTPTGADRVAQIFREEVSAGRVAHRYLPYDYPSAARRFLRAHAPRLALVMETELWPNLIAACARAEVPMMYVNVRMSEKSQRGYRRVRALIAPALRRIEKFAVQTDADARRLEELGARAETLTQTGSIKFDIAPPEAEAVEAMRRDLVRAGGEKKRMVWVAGSTHDGEEELVLDAFARVCEVLETPPLLALAPRHPQRFAAVSRLCARRGYSAVLRSAPGAETQVAEGADIYLADTMGELPALLAAADVAFIGGSLTPVGGHNLLEASAAGVPVIFGMHMHNFAEIAELVLRHEAGAQVRGEKELAENVVRFLRDEKLRAETGRRGKKMLAENRGALAKVCALVEEKLRELSL
ncbi:MAG: 3-deoxy-D-manno-octulosonic acid transferase [Arenicellales bacterium IbO2]|nr:MAG: 3-deoxy-D-manno-octulosonic acid transferase [Arenicellales bacterium IbO2]